MTDPDMELRRRLAGLVPDQRAELMDRLGVARAHPGAGTAAQERVELSLDIRRALTRKATPRNAQ